MDAQLIVTAVLSALGGGTATTIFKNVWDWATGRAERRRSEVDRAYDKADAERRVRIIVEDSLMLHRRIMREAPCIDETAIPPYPHLPPSTGPIDLKERSE